MIPSLSERAAGVLLHPVSLGKEAYPFLDFLAAAGQSWWQMLPVGPRGACNSPYDSPSAFAGDPNLLSNKRLNSSSLGDFKSRNRYWLEDFAEFMTLKEIFGPHVPWSQWPQGLSHRTTTAMRRFKRAYADRIRHHEFLQYRFDQEWKALRAYAAKKNIGFIGDAAIFVSRESADVWAHQDLFHLDRQGNPTVVAGVPPDYFSATGQRWGNPLYRWDRLKQTGYRWWIERVRHLRTRFDLLRLDHFIGYVRYWEIPSDCPDATRGRYKTGPGASFFDALKRTLGSLPIIAEDLGVMTPEVRTLRDRYELPGMRVLQFAFGNDPEADAYKPHNYPQNCVVYTGTHDNDTTVGWFKDHGGKASTRSAKDIQREKRLALDYLQSNGKEIHWDMIRLALRSSARLAIIPAQDLLGLGSKARTNRPGTCEGNWVWHPKPSQLTSKIAKRLRQQTELYGRAGERKPTLV